MADKGTTAPQPRAHKATYATDKRKGGYLIRVEGPTAGAFVGREVPVTMRNGDEHNERLVRLIWTGADTETGKPVALYAFESRPRDAESEETF
jgi:hypothetical protein